MERQTWAFNSCLWSVFFVYRFRLYRYPRLTIVSMTNMYLVCTISHPRRAKPLVPGENSGTDKQVVMLFLRCLADQKDRQGLYCRADCLSFHDSDSIGRGGTWILQVGGTRGGHVGFIGLESAANETLSSDASRTDDMDT